MFKALEIICCLKLLLRALNPARNKQNVLGPRRGPLRHLCNVALKYITTSTMNWWIKVKENLKTEQKKTTSRAIVGSLYFIKQLKGIWAGLYSRWTAQHLYIKVMSSRWVYLTTLFLGRLSPLIDLLVHMHVLSPESDSCPSWISGRERMADRKRYFSINFNERMCRTQWVSNQPSRKHAYIVLTPLKPHFYIVKLGFTGV